MYGDIELIVISRDILQDVNIHISGFVARDHNRVSTQVAILKVYDFVWAVVWKIMLADLILILI